MRVVFMGTPDFSVGTLRELAKAGHEIAGVISQPDKPKGRGKNLQPTPVKEAAMELGLPVYQPKKVRDPEFIQVMKELNPDVIVVVAFGQIIPKEILHMPKYGCINVHASLLPAYRGAAPIQWAVINGDKESGVTIMRMDEGVDTGDMINKVIVPLNEKETGGSLFDRLSESGAKLLVETLPMLEDGSAVFEKQPEESTTPYAAMISKKMGELDWAKSATELERLIRGLNPWPSAFSHLNGKTLKIWEASVEEENGEKKAPGTVLQADAKGFRIQTGEGILKIDTLQMEGKTNGCAGIFTWLYGGRRDDTSLLVYRFRNKCAIDLAADPIAQFSKIQRSHCCVCVFRTVYRYQCYTGESVEIDANRNNRRKKTWQMEQNFGESPWRYYWKLHRKKNTAIWQSEML